jgi:hypothetical protein
MLLVLLRLLRGVFGQDGEEKFFVGTGFTELGGFVKYF